MVPYSQIDLTKLFQDTALGETGNYYILNPIFCKLARMITYCDTDKYSMTHLICLQLTFKFE